MDINTLLCNDEGNDVEMKDVNDVTSNKPMLPELEQPKASYESTNPILYSSMVTSGSSTAIASEDMPNMNSLTINSPTSTPSTPPTPPSNIITSKLDSLSGIAAATAALRQRKHVRNSPRARKSSLSIGNSSNSPGSNHYPYTTTVGSSRHRLLAPVTPQPPPSHPISSAILRRNRIQNGIRNVVRGVSDTLFMHSNQHQNQNQQTNEASNTESNSSSTSSYSTHNIFGHINNRNNASSSTQPSNQQSPLMSDNNTLNQDDVNHGIKCCLQWLKYAITHLDQEINLLRNIANESFHMYCNNIQNYRNTNIGNNNENSSSNSEYLLSQQQEISATSNSNNNNNGLLPPFQLGSNQLSNIHRKSLMEIKRDIVFTIRKTVEIIIKGASKYLPGESRLIIRRFILSLPSRLSKLTQRVKAPEAITSSSTTNANGKMDADVSVTSSPTSSYMTDETETLKMANEDEDPGNAMNATKEESLKIMTLATEGNDMLKKMMDVFEKSFQENNKNNLDNINLINTNEASTLNYNTSKMLYNNDKFNKLGNNINNLMNTTQNNSNYIMNYNDTMDSSTNN